MKAPGNPHASVQAYFDRDAARYPDDAPDHPVLRADYERTRRALMEALAPLPDDRVLEVGCGKGRWARLVAPAVGAYVGVDISEGMLAHARAVTRATDAAFERADFLEWAYDGPPFDKVFSVRVLEYFRDKSAMAARLAALVRPGGRLVLVTKTPRSPFRATGYLNWAWRHRVPRRRKAADAGGAGNGPLWWDLVAPRKLASLLTDVGFADVRWGPVILRPPLFAGSPGDIPLFGEKLARRFHERLDAMPLGPDVGPVWSHLAESYVLVARRADHPEART